MRFVLVVHLLAAGLLAQPDALRYRPTGSSNHSLNLVPSVLRSQPVELDLNLLRAGRRVPFAVFDGVRLGVRIDRVSAEMDARVWQGAIEGEAFSEVILVAYGQAISGHIRRGDGQVFELITLDGTLFLREIQLPVGPVPDDTVAVPLVKDFAARREADACAPTCDDGSVIDILVAYTDQLRVIRGGTDQVEAFVREGIAGTNAAFERTGIATRLRLVDTVGVQFQATNNLRTDLGQLWSTSDGILDELHARRRHYGADLVSLWTSIDSGGAGGVAYLGRNRPEDADLGFNVVAGLYAVAPLYAFAHEVGHNFGSQHDRANATSRPVFDYAYGFQSPAGATPFRTIMAYACAGVVCPVIPYFSSPANTYLGLRTGDGGTDNARAFSQTRVTLARYQQTVENPAAKITVAPQVVTTAAAGGSAVVTVTADGDWKSFSALPWVTLAPAAGSGNGRVTLTISANASAGPRSGKVIVGPYLVTVTQAGTPLAACPSLPIALDTTVPGELTTCAGAAYVYYTFQGVAGQPIAVELASTEFDPAMSLIGPPGYRGPFSGSTTVDFNDDYAGGTNARMPSSGNFTPLPVNGLYTILAYNNGAPNARGKFTLTTRSSAEYCKFSLPNGLRFGAGSTAMAVNIGAAAGCGWSLTSSASWVGLNLPGDRRGAAAVTLKIEPNPDATTRTSELVLTSAVIATPLRVPISQSAGTACAVEDLPLDTAVEGTIGATACQSLNRGAAYPSKRYQMLGKAGQRLTVSASSPDFDAYLALITASGALVSGSDRGRLGLDAAAVRLPADGLYYIEVSGFDAGITGRFTIETNTKLPPPLVDAAALLFDLPNALELPAVTEGTLFANRLFEFEVPTNAVGLDLTGTVSPATALVSLHLRANEPPVQVDGQVIADATATPSGETGNLSLTLSADSVPPLRPGRYYLALSQSSLETPATVAITPRIRRATVTSFQLVDQIMTIAPANVCTLQTSRADTFRPVDKQAAFVFTGVAQRGGIARIQFIDPLGTERAAVDLPAATADGDYCGQALLPVAGTVNGAAPGRWRARLSWDGQEVFSRTFVIADAAVALPPALTLGQAQALALDPAVIPLLLNRTAVYRVTAPAGVSRIVFRLSTQTGGADLDLYIRAGAPPSSNGARIVADFVSEGATGEESITVDRALSLPKLEDGTVYFVAIAQRTTGVAIRATLTATAITDPAVITRAGVNIFCQTNTVEQTEITPSISSSGQVFPLSFNAQGTARIGTVFSFEFVTPAGRKVQAQTVPAQAFDGAFCATATLELAAFTPFDWSGGWQALVYVNGTLTVTRKFTILSTTPPALINFPPDQGVSYTFTNPRSNLYPTQFLLKVPEGTRQLTLSMRSKSSNPNRLVNLDLYVQRGSRLTGLQQSTASAVSDAPDETLTIANPAAGDYYVGIGSPNVYTFVNVSIMATMTGAPTGSTAGRAISAEAVEDSVPVRLR